jgi:hypothetical protein
MDQKWGEKQEILVFVLFMETWIAKLKEFIEEVKFFRINRI